MDLSLVLYTKAEERAFDRKETKHYLVASQAVEKCSFHSVFHPPVLNLFHSLISEWQLNAEMKASDRLPSRDAHGK